MFNYCQGHNKTQLADLWRKRLSPKLNKAVVSDYSAFDSSIKPEIK